MFFTQILLRCIKSRRLDLTAVAMIFFLFFYIIFCPIITLSFEVEEIDDGVYVHYGIHEDSNSKNEGDIANIGFIVGERSIMVIDTGGTPEIGKELLKAIKKISILPISHVVITHSHPDHYFGTQEFLNAKPLVIGHEKLNRSLINNFEFYKSLQQNTTKSKSIKTAKLVKANVEVKINKILKVDLGNRIIEIKAWKSGHTDNDLSVYDTKTKIFWSENVFVTRIPSIRASVLGWKKNLEEILNMDINLIVPGHGKPLEKEKAIKPILSYFNRLIDQMRSFHKNNKSLQESINQVLQNEIIDPQSVNKEKWVLFTEYHYTNITKVYTELEWE